LKERKRYNEIVIEREKERKRKRDNEIVLE
jgi:hypothetical protein